ncbi:MAG: IclR family transcriptional regulator [Flavobacterium sp. MedPE-SWcel]|uniref:uracil-DNA glycosylase family protein n=1 Tax=uncultured Flavobacterium sp. TaxID=165435 RepID=UPI00091582F5|nr:uracil-DNA glycosylase family protein [uncultured Flavobacterium sp.]OIQ21108.1 MAG: IclR family transcriptional regulator [Flavobacterium sp. MedPE-SWcel]
MDKLLLDIKDCRICEEQLPLGPRPVVAARPKSKIIIIGQAPGTAVHKTGIPWYDKSGENLRRWMGVENEVFYDAEKIGIIPMGFCYPGRGKSGDNPPTKECAPKWHGKLFDYIEKPELILLIGKYSQDYYLRTTSKRTLTETVRNYKEYLPKYFVLPHPSPRNNIWMKKNEWFKDEVLPSLKESISQIL